jgi:hypothetical protein
MINTKALKAAINIFKVSGLDNVALQVNGQLIDIRLCHVIRTSKDDTKHPIFIEFDTHHTPGGMYIFIWSPEHPQYEWIKQNTDNKYSEGMFAIGPDYKSLTYVGSIYDVEC